MNIRIFRKVLYAAILLFGISSTVTAKEASEPQTSTAASTIDTECWINVIKNKLVMKYSYNIKHRGRII